MFFNRIVITSYFLWQYCKSRIYLGFSFVQVYLFYISLHFFRLTLFTNKVPYHPSSYKLWSEAMDTSLPTLNNDEHINNPCVQVDSGSPFSLMSVLSIQILLDERVHSLACPWKASIPFPLYVVDAGKEQSSSLFDETTNTDLCFFLNGQKLSASQLYFILWCILLLSMMTWWRGGGGGHHAPVGLY